MGRVKKGAENIWEGLLPASKGAGPLLERDYWGVIRECDRTCPEVAELVRKRFPDFPPESLVVFRRAEESDQPLDVGDELEVNIRMAGETAVRVVHTNANSITLGTMKGHPEAGRITFGAYRSQRGDVIFHIRSHARSSTSSRYAGFLTLGESMQTNTWTDFIDRLAHMVGDGVIGSIFAETRELDEEEDIEAMNSPTYIAEGE